MVAISVLNMETSGEQIAGEVFMDCPVCCSGNRLKLENPGVQLACEDCGFVLAEARVLGAVDFKRCVFCGGEYFYTESALPLSLLGRDSVCYVCEAKYKGMRSHDPGQRFNADTHAEAQKSDASKRWRERVDGYNQGAG